MRLSALNTGSASTVREGSFNVNGLRSTFNNFLLDGLDNNAYGTSNQGFSNQVMQPLAGRGGGVQGRDQQHERGVRAQRAAPPSTWPTRAAPTSSAARPGSSCATTALNATGFFKPVNGEKPPLSRNQFGFVFGGPIVKNRAFFFVDYEGFRQTREQVAFSTIPNAAAARRASSPCDVRDPRTGARLPGGHARSR